MGSHAAAEWMQSNMKGAKVKIYDDFDNFIESFRSESGKKQQPPPKPTKTTVRTHKYKTD